ncbi:MAG: hypothetical protein Q9227_007052 [Pyrenula ochraceoflavens]
MATPPPGYVAASQLDRRVSCVSETMSNADMTPPPPESTCSEDPSSLSPPKEKKKRKSWGQEIPDIPRTLGPRKRAKTDQERQQRNIERIERNRHSAAKSREKQKAEAAELRRQNEEQKEYIQQLEERLRQLQGGSAPSAMPSAMPSTMPPFLTPTSEHFPSPSQLTLKSEADGSDFTEDCSVHGSYYATPPSHSMSRSGSTMSDSTLAPPLNITHAERMLLTNGSRNSANTRVEHQHRSLGGSHKVSVPKVENMRRPETKAATASPDLFDLPMSTGNVGTVGSADLELPQVDSPLFPHALDGFNLDSLHENDLADLDHVLQGRDTITQLLADCPRQDHHLDAVFDYNSYLDDVTSPLHSPKSAHLLMVAAGRASRRLANEGFDPVGDSSQANEWASLMAMTWSLRWSLKAIGAENVEHSIQQWRLQHQFSLDPFHHQEQSEQNMENYESASEHREWVALLQASIAAGRWDGSNTSDNNGEWSTESLGSASEFEAELENLGQWTGSPSVLGSENNAPPHVF